MSDPSLAAVFQALPGASFIVNGATPAKNSALASAGAELRLANGVTLLGKFDGEFAGHSSTYAGTGTVRWTGERGAAERRNPARSGGDAFETAVESGGGGGRIARAAPPYSRA